MIRCQMRSNDSNDVSSQRPQGKLLNLFVAINGTRRPNAKDIEARRHGVTMANRLGAIVSMIGHCAPPMGSFKPCDAVEEEDLSFWTIQNIDGRASPITDPVSIADEEFSVLRSAVRPVLRSPASAPVTRGTGTTSGYSRKRRPMAKKGAVETQELDANWAMKDVRGSRRGQRWMV